MMSNWLHRLFNPHCKECKQEKFESQDNEVVAVLREELHARDRMLEQLINNLTVKPSEPVIQDISTKELIKPNRMTWRVRQQLLEAEDKKKASVLRDAAKSDFDKLTLTNITGVTSIEDIEKELGVKNELQELRQEA